MANPSIIAEPFKEIKAFESKWNASNLPIQYTIENDKFPVKDGIYPPDVTNYYTEIDIYVNGSLVGTIKQIPDSNNQTKVNIQKYVKSVLKYEPIPSVYVDDNAWCEFYIEGTENYVDSGGIPQSNPIDNSGEVFYASLSSLQFGNERGGNMYDYIIDTDKTDLAKWMTAFERGQLVDFTNYNLSIIVNNIGFDLSVTQFDINGNILDLSVSTITNDGFGLYRLNLDFVSFDDSVNYISVEALDYAGNPLSELFYIDVDLSCLESIKAPTNLIVTQTDNIEELELNWTDNTGGLATYKIFRGNTSGVLVEIDSGIAPSSYVDNSGLLDATEYFYEVVAVVDGLDSDPSNEASGTTISPLVWVIKTDNAGTSNNDQFAVPTASFGTFTNANVDWGDGNIDLNINSYNDPAWTHTFLSAGTYTIKIWGDSYNGMLFNNGGDKDKLLEIARFGEKTFFRGGAGANSAVFYGCSNAIITAPDILPIGSETSLDSFFRSMVSVVSIPTINQWDVSAITVFRNMFNGNLNMEIDISDWSINGSFNWRTTFSNCQKFQSDLSNWRPTGGDFRDTFSNCLLLNFDASQWPTLLVGPTGMFVGCASLDTVFSSMDFTSAINLQSWISFTGVSQANYDQILQDIDAQSVNNGVIFGAVGLQYTAAGAGGTARGNLITDHSWTFVGDIAN